MRCVVCGRLFPKTRRITCSKKCCDQKRASDRIATAHKNDFLPEDDEANQHGYWVPSPEEIRARMTEIRKENTEAKYYGYKRPPLSVR